jgi:membrane associated rhomboid family serine protease
MATPAGPRLLPPRPFLAAALMLLFTGLLYAIELYNSAVGNALTDNDCIVPREPSRLDGVLLAPLLHLGWQHLEGNAPWFLLFGFLAMAGGFGQFLLVTSVVWLVSGLGVWLISPSGSCTVGVSGVIFGWLMFLLFRGFYTRSATQILLAVVLLVFWGGLLLGLIPGDPQVSWQAHLFGALGGILAARMVSRARQRAPKEPVMPQ